MARKIKNKAFNVRVDEALYALANDYIDRAHLNIGDLVRAAVAEYISNNPVKEDK